MTEDLAQWFAIAFLAASCLALTLGQHEMWQQCRGLARRVGDEFRRHRSEEH